MSGLAEPGVGATAPHPAVSGAGTGTATLLASGRSCDAAFALNLYDVSNAQRFSYVQEVFFCWGLLPGLPGFAFNRPIAGSWAAGWFAQHDGEPRLTWEIGPYGRGSEITYRYTQLSDRRIRITRTSSSRARFRPSVESSPP